MALSEEEMYYMIRCQSQLNGDYTCFPPIIHKEMAEEQIHKIVGAYIMFTLLGWCALVGVALIAGVLLWLFGAL